MKGFKKILSYIKPYWFKAALSIFFNFIGTTFSLFSFTMAIPFLRILFEAQPKVTEAVPFKLSPGAIMHNFNYFLSNIIDEKGPQMALLTVSILVVFFVMLKSFFSYLGNYTMASIRTGIIKDIRNKMYDKVTDLQLSYFSEEKKGDIISRMSNDVQEIEVSIVRSLNKAFKEPITIIVYLYFLFFTSVQLTFFVLLLLPLSGFVIARIGKSLRKKSARGQLKLGYLMSYIEESLYGMRIIKAFNAEGRIKHRFHKENGSYTRLMKKIFRRKDLANPLSEFLSTSVIVIVMWVGGNMVLGENSTMSSEVFMTYLIIFSQIIKPAKNISSVYYNIQKGMASFDRVEEVLNAKIKVKEKADAKPIETFNEKIEYKNVFFKYIDEYVLKDINLVIEKGKTVALVGQSGSGKSTMVDMLPRFYDVSKGRILIDENPIDDLKISDLRSLMGIVSQESILFNDSIYNNIIFGKPNATLEEVTEAAKIANAHEFILHTENGYETNIGDSGNKLSGGQKQRISIARAILKNPPILILDEATSSLDTESEKLVQDALDKLMKNRTSVVIAHRLSTIRKAGLICVMHEGEIVERGSHDELIARNGYYKKLHDMQMFA